MNTSSTTYDTTVRPGPIGLVVEGFKETWSRRRLIGYLVRADLKKKGADTLLGNLWWVIDPLLQMLVYVVLVTIIFARSTPDYPLFIFAAILPWKWFSSAVNDGVVSVTSQEKLIKQIAFPKIILPVAATMAGVVNFAFGMIPLAALLILFYAPRINPTLLYIPLIAVVQLVFTLAFATLISAVNVFYRDVGNVLRHLLRLWFYLSPALYSADQVAQLQNRHSLIGDLFNLNPFTSLFEAYRNAIYYGQPPGFSGLAGVLVASMVLLAFATLLFKLVEPTFAKVL